MLSFGLSKRLPDARSGVLDQRVRRNSAWTAIYERLRAAP
jgi:hypothetical protein